MSDWVCSRSASAEPKATDMTFSVASFPRARKPVAKVTTLNRRTRAGMVAQANSRRLARRKMM